jgi:hypothetical protein
MEPEPGDAADSEDEVVSTIAIRVCDAVDSEAGQESSVVIIGGGVIDSMAIAAAAGSNQRRGHYDLLGRGRRQVGGESKRGQGVMESGAMDSDVGTDSGPRGGLRRFNGGSAYAHFRLVLYIYISSKVPTCCYRRPN